MLERIGPYRIVRKLGEGGMGVVYAAEDERLHRAVAIKCIREAGDTTARERFMREARAAASLSHPNVCQLFDIGDSEGTPFLVMELLDGESLFDRLGRGTIPLAEAIRIALAILTALEALHGRGFVHRDLKPSNVFLTGYGVKLLDFGLARELHSPTFSANDTTIQHGSTPVTVTGMIVGTPRYMAPEQILGAAVDGRTDLFSAAVLLYEMVAGAPPFANANSMQLFHALVYENAPNLAGSAAISAVNRVIHRAMAKKPEDRYQSANAMAQDLRETAMISDAAAPIMAHKVTRLIVLPFRMLRPDAEIDFLAHAMPEAITTSLAAIRSLIIRSPMAAAKFAAEAIDLKRLATEADVDVVVSGTLLRAGEQIRVTAQLVEVPGGTVLSSVSSQATMAGIFDLQDALTERIIDSLALPRAEQESRAMRRDVPATPLAHEFYLRAGQVGESPADREVARDLYLRALEEDPHYAPAWARLARIYMLLGKFGSDSKNQNELAESAAKRALEINPELAIAHYAYATIELTTGRSREAMMRMLDRVGRGSNDPNLFAGLVTALRYCGLLEESAAAHDQARQLDPQITTSATYTFWMLGRYEEAIAACSREKDVGVEAFVFESMGRLDDAVAVFDDRFKRFTASGARLDNRLLLLMKGLHGAMLGDREAVRIFRERYLDFPDPEGLYLQARAAAHVGLADDALIMLDLVVQNGFFCFPFFRRDPWFDPLRGDERLNAVIHRAEARSREARRAFESHPGSRVLTIGAK
jgi:eukaryotic-like serine/threonine-protein kinase